jgi:hypothetical protein
MSNEIDDYLEGLYGAARNDGKPSMAAGQRRVLAAIGGSATVPASRPTPGAKSSDTWLKRGAGVVGVGLLIVGARMISAHGEQASMPVLAVPVVAALAGPSAPAELAKVPAVAAPSASEETPSISVDRLPSSLPSVAPRHATSTMPAPVAAASVQEAPRTSSIGEEIRLVDAARRHVAAHEGRKALRDLDEYQQRFGAGSFEEEAAALRIEALDRAGNHAVAVALGRRFMRNHPNSAYAARVALVVETSPSGD